MPQIPDPPRPLPARRIPLRELLGQAQVVEIEHQGQVYLLRLTRQGKLILTK